MSVEQPSRDFEDIKQLLADAEAGRREEAIGELIAGFEKHIRRLARQMLGQRLRRLLSSEDIMQSVCVKLVTGLREGNVHLRSEEEFIKLLKVMTQNTARDKHAYDIAGKRDSRRLRPLAPQNDNASGDCGLALPDRGTPTPSVVLRQEERQQILEQLYSEVQRLLQADEWHIYKRRYLDGAELAAIGAEWGASADAIRMRLKRINDDLRVRLKQYAEYLERQE